MPEETHYFRSRDVVLRVWMPLLLERLKAVLPSNRDSVLYGRRN